MHIAVSIIATIIGALASGYLYRMGGDKRYNTKFRDLGVPTVFCLVMWACGWGGWTLVLSFGALFGSLTTYFKKKGSEARWWNWALCGLSYGVSALPVAWEFGLWWGLLWRTLFLVISVALWSELVGKDTWEERGRGFFIVASIPLFFIK